jgi:hypothetical protein
MRGSLHSAMLMGSLVLATPGQAQAPPGAAGVQAKSGQEVRLLALNNTGGECSGLPMPDVRIQEPPRGGIIIVRYGQTKFADTAPQCAGREVPGLGVYYRSDPSFSGNDRVRIESGAPGQPSQGGQTFNLIVSQ